MVRKPPLDIRPDKGFNRRTPHSLGKLVEWKLKSLRQDVRYLRTFYVYNPDILAVPSTPKKAGSEALERASLGEGISTNT